MKNAYIIHGTCDEKEFFDPQYPCGSNFHWLSWLQDQLVMKGYNCQTPQMPTPYNPDYVKWNDVFKGFPVDVQTTLVGHSAGCGFFLKWLSQNDVKIEKLVLVAPWLDPYKKHGDFLSCALAPDLADRVEEIHVFFSEDDSDGVPETVERVMDTYPSAILHKFTNHGHFCRGDMGTDEFPELLEVIIGSSFREDARNL